MVYTSSPFHLPRLYCDVPLVKGSSFSFSDNQSHYLRHVLRKSEGDCVRVFNSSDGEYRVTLTFSGKKSVVGVVGDSLRAAESFSVRRHLVFSPIKKDRMDFLIEKAVELGVTDFHPLVMRRSVVRDVKTERIFAQIIEAAEQCERMDIPLLHPLCSFSQFLQSFPQRGCLYAAIERVDAPLLRDISILDQECFYLVGPEGGFDPEEVALLDAQNFVHPVSLGSRILRAETAALFGLSLLCHAG